MFNIFVKYRIFLFNLKTLKFYSFDGSPVLIPVWNINTRYSTCACVLWNWNWEILNFKLKVYSVSVIGDVQLRKRFPGNAQSPVQAQGQTLSHRGRCCRFWHILHVWEKVSLFAHQRAKWHQNLMALLTQSLNIKALNKVFDMTISPFTLISLTRWHM